MKKIVTDIIGVAVLVALFLAFNYASYRKGYKKGENEAIETIIERVDTLTLHDTLTTTKPYYIVERIVDSITVKVPVVERDTILVNLPRTQRVYQDSTYRAVISGFAPNLDTISVYRKTVYVNNTVYVPTKDTRKDYVELDARLMWDKQFLAPVTLNIGHKFGFLDVSAGGGYDFFTRTPMGQIDAKLQFKF